MISIMLEVHTVINIKDQISTRVGYDQWYIKIELRGQPQGRHFYNKSTVIY